MGSIASMKSGERPGGRAPRPVAVLRLLGAALCSLCLGGDLFAQETPVGKLKTLSQIAVRRRLPPGAPRASDVCMRSLGVHPHNAKDPRDTLKAVRDFHVSHIVWIYTTD